MRGSVQALAKEMGTGNKQGGFVSFDLGNLTKSVVVQIGSMPTTAAPGTIFSAPDISAYAHMEVGDTAFVGWQANYARRVNYGYFGTDSLGRSYNQSGANFVDKIAAKWPQIVKGVNEKYSKGGGAGK